MQCSICKNGTTKQAVITVPLVKDNSVVIVKGVPAEVCQNCGEYYLDEKQRIPSTNSHNNPSEMALSWK